MLTALLDTLAPCLLYCSSKQVTLALCSQICFCEDFPSTEVVFRRAVRLRPGPDAVHVRLVSPGTEPYSCAASFQDLEG